MIQAHISQEKQGRLLVRITGHAGAADQGEDVVCAGASALLLTLLGGAEKELDAAVIGQLEPGLCDVELVVSESRRQGLRLLADVFRYGFRRLMETYPERVNLIEGGTSHGA